MKTLHDLLAREIQALYSSAKQLGRALPKMAEHASYPGLAAAFMAYLDETKQQVARLETAAEVLGIPADRGKCRVMETMIWNGTETLLSVGIPAVKDVSLLAGATRMVHSEIAGYRTAMAIAGWLEQTSVAKMMQQSLFEVKGADQSFQQLGHQMLTRSNSGEIGGHALAGNNRSQGDEQ